MFLLSERDGELEVDHRASPGIPGTQFREGSVVRLRTYGCPHCHTPTIVREERVSDRPYCRFCNAWICEICARVRMKPDYVHQTFQEIADKIASGKYHYIGPIYEARLIPKEQMTASYSP